MSDQDEPQIAQPGETFEPETLLAELRARVTALTQSRPEFVDPATISFSAKTPYKLLTFREAILWRLEELAGAAILHFERNELAAALVLTRSAAECSAATWYLMEIVEDFNSDGTLELLDERAEKLLLGFKDNPEMPSAINVLTMFDRANKTVPGIKRNYEALSEYAHPNWSGTSLLFAQLDREKLLTMFGKNARAKNGPIGFGLNSLGLALTVFAHSYNRVSEAFPTLIAKCEAALPKS